MDTKLCPFCLHSNEDWEDWLYFCIRGCLPKNLFQNVLASKWHVSLKRPNGLSVGKWNQEVACHNLKMKRTKLVLRNIWRRVFCRSLTRCCHCHYTSYRPMLFLYCFHNCWNWLKNREDILLLIFPSTVLAVRDCFDICHFFYTKPDKTTKEPESPKCCMKLFDGDFLVFVKRQLTFWLTFSSLSIGVKKSSIFCWHSA